MRMSPPPTRHRLRTVATSTATALAVLIAVALPPQAAQATEPPVSPSATTPVMGPEAALSAQEQRELQSLLSATDPSRGTFDVTKARDLGASEQAIADFATSYQAAGRSVLGLTVTTQIQRSDVGERVAAAAASCTGTRGYTGFYGWGWQWALNSCDTDLLMAALAGVGGGTAAVGGIISAAGVTAPAGAVTAAVGGLIAAGAGVIGICKAASYEAKAIYLNAYVIGSVGCWGQ